MNWGFGRHMELNQASPYIISSFPRTKQFTSPLPQEVLSAGVPQPNGDLQPVQLGDSDVIPDRMLLSGCLLTMN